MSEYIKSNITILIDTKEKEFKHISNYLDLNGIKYIRQNLNVGDYSFIFKGKDYSNEIIIERKANLDELVNNFVGYVLSTRCDDQGKPIKLLNRDRFEREFLRMPVGKKYLLLEDTTWDKIYKHNYRSKYPPESLSASIYTFQHRYNIEVMFSSKLFSPNVIYGEFYYYMREKILNARKQDE